MAFAVFLCLPPVLMKLWEFRNDWNRDIKLKCTPNCSRALNLQNIHSMKVKFCWSSFKNGKVLYIKTKLSVFVCKFWGKPFRNNWIGKLSEMCWPPWSLFHLCQHSASSRRTSYKICRSYAVLISELVSVCVCVNMLLAPRPLPLLLITTSVLQSHLIRIHFSVLALFLLLCLFSVFRPFSRTRSEGAAGADFISSRAGLSKWKRRVDVRALHYGFVSHTAGHACWIWLCNEAEGKNCAL